LHVNKKGFFTDFIVILLRFADARLNKQLKKSYNMKKYFLVSGLFMFLFSCGGGETKPAENKTAENTAVDAAAAEKALELIGTKGCTACHAIDKKLIGPAYIDVSKKYEATDAIIDTLSNKVIKGGKGVWGEVPMTPNNVTPEEAKQMVTYILSLKNQ
jgi:cytochrome c